MRNYILFIVLCFLPWMASGQQVLKPLGNFGKDSVKLGELIEYRLVHHHPAAQEVILPDSNYSFAPFELVSKYFYPTVTKAGISTDSAVYILRTFETQAVQFLSVPVYVLQQQDTLTVSSDTNRIILHQLVSNVQEPLLVKAQTGLVQVEERFNWPYLLLWIVAGLAFLALIWFIFGQAIRIKYNLYRLRKDHLYFVSRYASHVDRFVKSGSAQSMEKAVALWKNYLTRLERSAINSFTTKEIVEYYNDDEEVNTSLRLCDRAIYGNLLSETDPETRKALSMLRRFAKRRYKTHRELTKNAKNK
ncbi:hypothetical protein ACFSKU_05075 [Pontibacter silvestris]|uniref:DUF4129 domain-containing protein n=1 Tax=Pontibacter silvestris TaxID=2305183 RepID=A0ABW4WVR0_9BACT|nr:hypothetical protein [Pontibacter silvestris]MCC9136909.1 hypothetical protein [Pontibacter silvestris]